MTNPGLRRDVTFPPLTNRRAVRMGRDRCTRGDIVATLASSVTVTGVAGAHDAGPTPKVYHALLVLAGLASSLAGRSRVPAPSWCCTPGVTIASTPCSHISFMSHASRGSNCSLRFGRRLWNEPGLPRGSLRRGAARMSDGGRGVRHRRDGEEHPPRERVCGLSRSTAFGHPGRCSRRWRIEH